ncbi:MAG: efflux RND transporter periplasmic adaptor subunit [Cohaesibacter sp.]|jgi:RND family efflux transporter MFP subunit|nr:efflux RND transporter periplasmic adaptor subunit [Cohaesibacter sp.]
MSILKKLLFIPPVALATYVFVASGTAPKPPQAADKKEKPTPVKIIGAKPVTVIPTVKGFGKVKPEQSWSAVAQVAGPVIWTADTLRNGLLISQGTDLLKIDPREYELGLAQIDAQIAALSAKDETTKASLAIERRAMDLLKQDLDRKQKLFKQGTTAKAAVDGAERAMLAAQAKVTSLASSLKLNAAERNILLRQKDIASLNLDRTHIKAPFDIRLGTVDISQGQYVNKGQKLFSGDGIQVAEVVAQFPLGALRSLLGKSGKTGAPLSSMGNEASGASDRHESLRATIRLASAKQTIEWDAKVDRVTEAMNPKTRTRGIILTIEDPYGKATPGQRPPLVRDMAVEVVLAGKAKQNKIVVPALAVRKGKVMIADAQKRLRFKPVKVAYIQGDIAVLMSGLEKDDKVIVSDMPAPVEGMLLAPRPDKKLQDRIIAAATGKKAARREGAKK